MEQQNTDFYTLNIKGLYKWQLRMYNEQLPLVGRLEAWSVRTLPEFKGHVPTSIVDMVEAETEELFKTILPAFNDCMKNLSPIYTHPNLLIMCNKVPLLHAHIAPRYEHNKPTEIFGYTCVDPGGDPNLVTTSRMSDTKMKDLKGNLENGYRDWETDRKSVV